ncbi:MAG: terminase large subunit [Flavobacteriales bacterium]|nr:terminase large subunit [Flavobacteriales bacterium]
MDKYYFDKEAADRAVSFIEEFITHTKGELAGKPLILEEWQSEITKKIFGWKHKETGYRKFRTVFIEVARKNGKTTWAASLSNYMLFADNERGSEIYAAAGDRNQAGLVFEIAKGMILNNPELSNRGKVFRNSITNEAKGNFFQAISSDSKTKHGFNANCIIFDELHTQPNRDLWDTLLTSTGSRRQPLVIAITTAGYDKNSICHEVYSYAKSVLDGSIIDESFLPVIYEADEDDDITSEETWIKANPNYGVSLRKEYMEREAKKAMDIPNYMNTFKRLHLNIWTTNETKWMNDKEWMDCQGDLGDLSGMAAWGGIDLATTRDISAFVLLFKVDNKFKILPFFFVPEDNAKKRSDRDGIDYLSWINQGHIIATPGNVTDYSFIRKKVNELSKKYRIQSIAYDRWNASQLVIDLQGDGANMSPLGQGYASLSAPTKQLEKLILGKEIEHNGNPVLRWMIGNVQLEVDAADNHKPSKKKSKEKIDGVVATICALAEYMSEEKDGDSIYDNRGLLIL